jgi:hypothetical protein
MEGCPQQHNNSHLDAVLDLSFAPDWAKDGRSDKETPALSSNTTTG